MWTLEELARMYLRDVLTLREIEEVTNLSWGYLGQILRRYRVPMRHNRARIRQVLETRPAKKNWLRWRQKQSYSNLYYQRFGG